MSDSCHLDRALNVEIGVECRIFVIILFFNCSQVLKFGVHSRYYKGALTQKRSLLVLCTTFRSSFHVGWKNQNKHSTLNFSFDDLLKWHDPQIKIIFTIPDALGQDVMRQAQLVKSLFELQREFILISTGYEFNDSPESGRHFTNPLGR